jgi:putative membrane protein insertion efficiency factor
VTGVLSMVLRLLTGEAATAKTCKYHPTCSQYAHDAVHKHGLAKGSLLAAWRVLRCNPWSRGGVDYA